MQQINLLTTDLLTKSEPLLGRHFIAAWGGLAVLLVALTSWHGVSLWGLHEEMASAQIAVERMRTDNAAKRANTLDPEALREQVGRLSERQIAQAQLMDLLRAQQETEGFSMYLEGLARARVDGLWLNEILIAHDTKRQVSLKGATIDAINIPALLQNLAAQDQFSGQRFDRINLTSDADAKTVEFAIISPAGDAPG